MSHAVRSLALGLASILVAASAAIAQVGPAESAKLAKPAEGLEAKLWASEPMIVNPTSMEIDSRGRVWVAEGLNYRLHRSGGRFSRVDDSDKIKILQDTDGDGTADKMSVFADKIFPVPMGMALEERWSKDGKYLGCKVYVGNSPDLLVLEDTDGDDKADKRYALLTGFGGVDSDHGVHGMILGLDGKLYFTHGDGCCSVQPGRPDQTKNFDVVDKSGRHVSSDQLANTLRVNRDGTQFEILADRQRNNYETCLNSFGNGFTSDNDDDGNRGSRVIWVMDGGSYGYRTPGSPRHWGEDTPGPVPKLVGTGNGSPCGIMCYEGNALPDEYFGSLFEVDAGTRQVNFFPLTRHGASFRTVYKVFLGSDDPWFRPVDAAAAPDGSVFVADWYDAGVGGHAFRDQTTGRIYRVSRKGAKPEKRTYDFGAIVGLIDALQSPVVAAQDAARALLISRGEDSVAPLGYLFADGAPHVRARALWVLQAIQGPKAAIAALGDRDARIREQAVRILGRDVADNGKVEYQNPAAKKAPPASAHLDVLKPLANDDDPGVRRELILAFRNLPTSDVGDALATLAAKWDGHDRWYLEALGLAIQKREGSFLAKLFDGSLYGDLDLSASGKNGSVALPPYFPADRNEAYIATGTPDPVASPLSKTLGLAWRIHRLEALNLVSKILPSLAAPELQQAADDVLMQLNDPQAAVVLADLALSSSDPARANQLLATISRKIGTTWRDARENAKVVKAVESALANPSLRVQGVALASATFDKRYGDSLMAFARDEKASDEVRVAAIEAVGRTRPAGTVEFLEALIASVKGKPNSSLAAEAAVRALPSAKSAASDLANLVSGSRDYPLGLRREALRTYSRLPGGGTRILALAREKRLPEDLRTEATTIVHRLPEREIREQANDLLPLPKTAGGRRITSLFEIIRRDGDAEKGRAVFHRTGNTACATCHRAQGLGQWIGPDLSTIGTKYGKPELLQSILNPSEAIGYNFRSVVAETQDGRVVTGLPVEDAGDRLLLKTADGQRISLRPSEISERKYAETSLMPEGLAETMTDAELVDLLAFLQTLKQPVSVVGQYQSSGAVAPSSIDPSKADQGTWRRVSANAESAIDLGTISGDDASKVVYLRVPVVSPEDLDAKLVLEAPAGVEALLDGKPIKLTQAGAGSIRLSKGAGTLILKVPGGSRGGLVSTIVAVKPIEFR